MPGMRWTVSRSAPLADYAGRILDCGRRAPDSAAFLGLPDLADPATLGCVIALLDEAYGDWWVEPSPGADMRATRWAVYFWNGSLTRRIAVGATRIEALIAALEAAP
jgi:hypothetical protein